jgi:hypothetical protein
MTAREIFQRNACARNKKLRKSQSYRGEKTTKSVNLNTGPYPIFAFEEDADFFSRVLSQPLRRNTPNYKRGEENGPEKGCETKG